MSNPWIMKMEQFTRFTPEERQTLERISGERLVTYDAGEDIITDGDHEEDCHLMLEGLACRYKILADGKRQIMAFLVPGDLCDAEIFVLKQMDHAIGALTPSRVALIHSDKMKSMLRSAGSLAEALWWGTLTDLGVLRERIIDHGARSAHVRLAHLLYEMLIRYRMFGDASDNSFEFPITQEELADATGMSPVHANRMLQKLRNAGLIHLERGRLTVADPPGLKKLAMFDAEYLHLDRVHDPKDGVAGRVGDLI
jgi:CRP-like cAMP-binding protein